MRSKNLKYFKNFDNYSLAYIILMKKIIKKMKTSLSYTNISSINISFNIEHSKENINSINNLFQEGNICKESIKRKFPECKIFRINSFVFNAENERKEIYTKYDCIYTEKNNSLYLIFNEKVNYLEFTKDKLINILDFSNSIDIGTLYILINKKNKRYKNIIQDMLLVGFEFEKNNSNFVIDGNIYKSLRMSIKDITQEIRQIDFI